jgi:hypothetical protein
MAKFSTAKCNGATDTRLQQAHNHLIDLLDRGQVFESLVNGHRVKIVLDTSGGFTGFVDGVKMFGLDATTGQFTIKSYEDLIASLGAMAYEDTVESDKLGATIIDGNGWFLSEFLNANNIIYGNLIIGGSILYENMESLVVYDVNDNIIIRLNRDGIVVPAPTENGQAANKEYVDSSTGTNNLLALAYAVVL